MLKMDLGADIDNIPYLLYMTEQEQGQRAETADLSFCYCGADETAKNGDLLFKGVFSPIERF